MLCLCALDLNLVNELAKNGITKFNSLILRILSNRQFVFS